MSKQLRYMGEFLSRAGVTWRVEILQEADAAFGSVGQLTFEADEALVIDWKHTDKEEVICGSEATLKIESPGDRTYEDLYTIEVGRIRMDVYRENALYWSGALDPEFYEEPYERARHYVVTLTFSDFGILGRLKYGLSGMRTLHEIIEYALGKGTVNYAELDDTTYCSTYFADSNTKATPSALSVRSENFFDEDGEASTLEDVLIGILQPLALKMTQRNGKIYVYDLNGLHKGAPRRAIEWDGDSQTMGTDKVANNVRVNFSPYSSAKLHDDELEYKDKYGAEYTNLTDKLAGVNYNGVQSRDGTECYSYYPDYGGRQYGSSVDYSDINFTIFLSSKGAGLAYLSPSARYFHIQPMVGGPSETTGVAWSFHTGGHGALTTGRPVRKLNAVGKGSDTVLMRTGRVFIPGLSDGDRKSYYLRLALDMLLDVRYNPFSEPKDNEEDNYNSLKERTGWVFVPVGITLYDADGTAVCHFSNKAKTVSGTQGSLYWSMLSSKFINGGPAVSWEEGEAQFGDCWLAYYDSDDLKDSTGVLGWKKNRQNIGRPDFGGSGSVKTRLGGATNGYVDYSKGYFPSQDYGNFYMYGSFKKMADGEYIPYPEMGGFIEVVVYAGVNCYDWGEPQNFDTTVFWDDRKLYDKVRWLLYKAPVLDVVRANLIFDEAELDDVEYSGSLNAAAKEEISIDTICGTTDRACPTARGIYHRASNGLQVQTLKRAGVTDHPEKLLIGTLYSQYARRHTTLSGEAVIDTGGLAAYTERNQAGKVFIISSETQDVIADTSEVGLTEFNADEYEAGTA